MRDNRAFFDTNVLVYAFAVGDPRTEIAEALLAAGGVVGVQTLNEFVAVAVRKLAMPWKELLEALKAIRVLCPAPVPVTIRTHDAALRLAGRYRYHIYDALVIAAAIEASCSTLYSEDLRDGQQIEGLTIRNPFQRPCASSALGKFSPFQLADDSAHFRRDRGRLVRAVVEKHPS